MHPSAIAGRALEMNLESIGITDHPHQDGLDWHHDELASFRERCAAPLRIYIGAELEVIAPGRLVIDLAKLPLADYLLAAPSHYEIESDPPVDDLRDPRQWAKRLQRDFQWVLGSGASGVAHPFYVFNLIAGYPEHIGLPHVGEVMERLDIDVLRHVMAGMEREGIALELSRRVNSHPTFEEFMGILYGMAKEIGVLFFTGSDAHKIDAVGVFETPLRRFMSRLGISESDLWSPAKFTESKDAYL